ncbi:BTAD domain-containing putative transcriptional regulator [Gordonia sp. LSe1-13]|uniref:BTAD domain-containing putative transcriptional regulator n=1 Tax=Gordonia sesuvii TaxID=3116777 RepID=A0ABU7MCI8_9ACTN|nr:BTAD domain-containing putative transcriptional regulator [Gordonia sp. LSe1-13]
MRDLSDDASEHRPAIAVLGSLEVRAPDGDLVPISARRHVDLLAILAAERSVRSAGYLCELLWRGDPPDSALVTLQGYVLRLRRALKAVPDIRIDTEGGGYVLRCTGPSTDLDLLDVLSRDAREASADGDVERAVTLLAGALRLWRGDALADIDDITEIAPERARLDELRSELTEMCAEGLITLGRARQAVSILTEARGRHPLREGTARLLALALRDSGRTSEGLDVLVDVRRRLRDELGLDPAVDTVRVEAELRSPVAAETTAAPVTRLVGRGDATVAIDRAWRNSTTELTVVTVRGAAGIGKSALLADALQRHRAPALFAGGPAGAKNSALEAVSTWLDQLAVDGRTVPENPTPRSLAALLAALARETGHVVAVIEDAHRVDIDSLRMIAAAARVIRGQPVVMLMTVRDDPMAADVDEALRTLRSAGTHHLIDLVGLTDTDVSAIVDAELGSAASGVRAMIIEQSAGSPFVAAQLCDLVRAGRDLTPGIATAEVIRMKLDFVSDPARRLAELLAVIGSRATLGLAMTADAEPQFDDRLRELVTAQIVRTADGFIEFAHDLVRGAVLDRVGAGRRADLHRRVADALESTTPGAATAIASHRSAAAMNRLDPSAAEACASAARTALRHSAFHDCVEFCTRGLRHAGPSERHLRIELDSLAGQAQTRLGDYDAAAASFDRAGRTCADVGDWLGLGRVALLGSQSGVGGYFSGYGVVQSGSAALRTQALAHRDELPDRLVAELEAVEAVERAVHGIPGDLDHLADARARCEPGSDAWQQVKLAEFICIWDPATVAERSTIADELSDLAGADLAARATALHLRRVCALESGDLRLVRRLSAEFARTSVDGGNDTAAMQLWWRVMIAVLRGDYERSRQLMEAVENMGAVDGPARLLAEASMLTSRSIELWHKGRLAEAMPEVDRMIEDFDDDFALVAAMGAAELGEHGRALRLIETILAQPGRMHGPRLVTRVPLLIEALLMVARDPRYRSEAQAFAERLEPHTEGWGDTLLVQWPGLVCLGPSGLYRGTVRAVLGRPDARDQVVAAMNRARAVGALPYEKRAAERLTMWPFVAD